MTQAKIEAYLDLQPRLPARRLEVYQAVKASGDYGATLSEVSAAVQRPLHAISGRVTELADAGWLVDSGRRREGQTVWIIGDGNPNRRHCPKKAVGRILSTRYDVEAGALDVTVRLDDVRFEPTLGGKARLIWL